MAAVAICLKLIEKGDHKWTNPNLPYNAAIDRLVSSLYMHHKYHSYYYLLKLPIPEVIAKQHIAYYVKEY